jgi:WD40 repeat protein
MPPLTGLLLAAALLQPLRTDRYGDPLPPGAVARLGSLRFFHGGGDIQQVSFSPDGKLIASRNVSGCRLWDAATGRELPLREEIRRAAGFFPVQGKLLAAECAESELRLWDVATGRQVRRLERDLRDTVFGISPDGRTLVWAAIIRGRMDESLLCFCDLLTEVVSRPTDPWEHRGLLQQVAFSADGRTLAVLYVGGRIDVWDVPGRRVRRSWNGVRQREPVAWLALSPEGMIVARAGGASREIRLWDIPTGRELAPLNAQASEEVTSLTFSADGKRLAACYEGGADLLLWDLSERKLPRRFRGSYSHIKHVAFSPDGTRLAGADFQSVALLELATGRPCHDFGHTNAVWSVAFSPAGSTIASGAADLDHLVRLWDPHTGALVAKCHGHDGIILRVTFSPDGRLLASGSQDGTARLWDAGTGKEVRRLEAHDGRVHALAFSPDGKHLATGGQRKALHLWDVASGRELRAFGPPNRLVWRLAFSPNGKTLATQAANDQCIRLWDLATGTQGSVLSGHDSGAYDFAFSPDGNLLATRALDGSVGLYDVAGGQTRHELKVQFHDPTRTDIVYGLCFSPDGRTLAAGYDHRDRSVRQDRSVRLWEVASGLERGRFEGHRDAVLSVAFSPDGRQLASGSIDRTVLVWDATGGSIGSRPNPSARELATWWEELASMDGRTAYRAVMALAQAGDGTVALLRERLPPILDAGSVARLVADLDHDRFAVREQAAAALAELPEIAEPTLRTALAGRPSVELRRRAEVILQQIDPANSPLRLRALRAVEVLEWIGTPAARRLLETLANGAPAARLTREAKASLERLAKRP